MKNAVLLCLLFYATLLSGQSADCPLPDDISCNDQINVTLGAVDGTYSLTPQKVIGYPDVLDPCVYQQLRVSPSFASCANVGSTAFYELIHSPVDGPETSLCWGYVVAEDKTAPTFTSCPASPLYISLEPNTQLTLTPSDLGVSATDNCAAPPTLTTSPDPFIITAADNGSTIEIEVIAADPSGNTSTCTVSVNVSVDNCSTGAAAPENLSVALSGPDVVFSWDAVPGAAAYAISLEYFKVTGGKEGKWKPLNGLPPKVNSTSFTLPLAELDGATLYRFSVRVSGGGNNCVAVIEFTPNNLAGASGRPLPPGQTGQVAAEGFRVYPNPVKGLLQIDFGEALPVPRRIQLAGLQGHILREQMAEAQAATAQVDVEGLPGGIYVLYVWAGAKMQASRVLVE